MQQEQQPYELTLDKVKEMIAFDKNSGIYKTLVGLIDCWYATEIQNGKTEEEALLVTLDKLHRAILSTSARFNSI